MEEEPVLENGKRRKKMKMMMMKDDEADDDEKLVFNRDGRGIYIPDGLEGIFRNNHLNKPSTPLGGPPTQQPDVPVEHEAFVKPLTRRASNPSARHQTSFRAA